MQSPIRTLLPTAGAIVLTWSTAGCLGATPTWGRVAEVRIINSSGEVIDGLSYEYNDEGQLVGTARPNGDTLEVSYGADGPSDAIFRGLTELAFTFSYDGGRLVQRIEDDGTDRATTRSYTYEGNRLVEIESTTDDSDPSTDSPPSTNVTTYLYDDQGRLAQETTMGGFDCCTTTFIYDDDAQLDRRESRYYEGQITSSIDFDYEDGRLVDMVLTNGPPNNPQRSTVEYNDEGLIAGVEGRTGRFDIEYEEGQVTALPVMPLLSLPSFYAIQAPYFDHMGRSFSDIDMESTSFFLAFR